MTGTINTWLEGIAALITANAWLAPLFALIAGLLTSITPCSLSSVPLVIAYVGGSAKKSPASALRFSLVFALGMALTFTALGAAAALLGRLMALGSASWWYLILGGLMILMALQTWGIIDLIPSSYAQRINSKRGYLGAFALGVLGGLFSSPCATPVLIALLALVARSGKPAWGVLLLLIYAVGHSALVVVAGTFMGAASKLASDPRYGKIAKTVNIVLGTLILLVGLYLVYTGL
jgi:cytochrome c-type biogenesis protein